MTMPHATGSGAALAPLPADRPSDADTAPAGSDPSPAPPVKAGGTPTPAQPAAMPPAPETAGPDLSPAPPAPETGGPSGPEPTRYGDWERKGIAVDF
jgi:hypothetical protein